MEEQIRERLEELDRLKVVFTKKDSRRKRSLLRGIRRLEITDPDDLAGYHESLCFLRAFPDDREILQAAEEELHGFFERVKACERAYDGELPAALVDTGIAGTPYHYPYGLPMTCWFVKRFGDGVDIDWEAYEEREDDPLSSLLTILAGWVETIATDDEELSVRDWFEAARGRRKVGFLRWLVERMAASGIPPAAQETLYDEMELMVRWELGAGPGSRTLARMPVQRHFYHKEALRGRTDDFRSEILRPLSRVRPVSRRRSRAWIDVARCALSLRAREFYPIVHANDHEVYEADLGRGVRIVLFGISAERRLPIETEYGALLVKNGVPLGYGVGAMLLDEMQIAVNVFPTFRGGESAFVFEQFARLFHHYFGKKVFIVEAYQQGYGNDEGLAAGSFWFYYKLGFRSMDPRLRALADEEAARLRRRPGSRTSRRLLERLARSNAVFFLDGGESGERVPTSLTRIGLRVSRRIEERFGGSRERAKRHDSREVARMLGIKDLARWPQSERTAFAKLSPMIALLPGLRDWTAAEKRSLANILRSKGASREARYARAVAGHMRLHRALETLSTP